MIERCALLIFASHIKIGVIGQVQDCGSVGHSAKHNLEHIIIAPGIGHTHIQCAWIVLVAIGTLEGKNHSITIHVALPNLVLEAHVATVQVVLALMIAIELIGLAVKLKVPLADAVGKTSRHLAGTGAVKEVVVQVLVAQYHVGQVAITVRHLDFKDAGTQRRKFHTSATGIDEFVGRDFATLGVVGVDSDALHINLPLCERHR